VDRIKARPLFSLFSKKSLQRRHDWLLFHNFYNFYRPGPEQSKSDFGPFLCPSGKKNLETCFGLRLFIEKKRNSYFSNPGSDFIVTFYKVVNFSINLSLKSAKSCIIRIRDHFLSNLLYFGLKRAFFTHFLPFLY